MEGEEPPPKAAKQKKAAAKASVKAVDEVSKSRRTTATKIKASSVGAVPVTQLLDDIKSNDVCLRN